jgi:hypothetical protein
MKPTGRGHSEWQDAAADRLHTAARDVANLEFLRLGHRTPPPRMALGLAAGIDADQHVLLCARGRELQKRFLDGHRGTSNHPGFGWGKPRVFALRTNGRNWKMGFLPTEASPRPRLRSRPPSSPRALTARGSFPRVGGARASVSHRREPCFEGCGSFPRTPHGPRAVSHHRMRCFLAAVPNGVASAGTLPRRPRTQGPRAIQYSAPPRGVSGPLPT